MAGFILPVYIFTDLRQLCHLLHAVAKDLPHFPNSLGDLHKLIDSGLVGHSLFSFPRDGRSRPFL